MARLHSDPNPPREYDRSRLSPKGEVGTDAQPSGKYHVLERNRERHIGRTVLREGIFRFRFFSADRGELPHVHVFAGRDTAKIWLDNLSVAHNKGLSRACLKEAAEIVGREKEMLLKRWHQFFG